LLICQPKKWSLAPDFTELNLASLHWQARTVGMEAAMAFRIADIGNEAQLVELGERLSKALSSAQHRTDLLDFSPEYLDAAKTMLAELSGEVASLPLRTISLTEQQVETFLDFDPVFLDIAKDMLRAFIESSERMGVMQDQIT